MKNITQKPHDDDHAWKKWTTFLQRWGLQEFVAWLLEATGPITIIGAQVVYVGQPLLELFWPRGHVKALAELLEEPQTTQAFVCYLREASST